MTRMWVPLRLDTASLAFVLVGVLPVIGPNALFQVGEGAALSRVAQVREHGT